MRMKNLNKTAFSLLEVLLGSVIFIISVGGIFATLNAVRTPVTAKTNALTAAVFGKRVLEALRSDVSEQASINFYQVCSGFCTTFDLALGVHHVASGSLPSGLSWPTVLVTANNTPCDTNGCLIYTVSCADGSGGVNSYSSLCTGGINSSVARKVVLNINW